jgi:hypothetical protein
VKVTAEPEESSGSSGGSGSSGSSGSCSNDWYAGVVSLDDRGCFRDLAAPVLVTSSDGSPLAVGERYLCTRTGDDPDTGRGRFRTRPVVGSSTSTPATAIGGRGWIAGAAPEDAFTATLISNGNGYSTAPLDQLLYLTYSVHLDSWEPTGGIYFNLGAPGAARFRFYRDSDGDPAAELLGPLLRQDGCGTYIVYPMTLEGWGQNSATFTAGGPGLEDGERQDGGPAANTIHVRIDWIDSSGPSTCTIPSTSAKVPEFLWLKIELNSLWDGVISTYNPPWASKFPVYLRARQDSLGRWGPLYFYIDETGEFADPAIGQQRMIDEMFDPNEPGAEPWFFCSLRLDCDTGVGEPPDRAGVFIGEGGGQGLYGAAFGSLGEGDFSNFGGTAFLGEIDPYQATLSTTGTRGFDITITGAAPSELCPEGSEPGSGGSGGSGSDDGDPCDWLDEGATLVIPDGSDAGVYNATWVTHDPGGGQPVTIKALFTTSPLMQVTFIPSTGAFVLFHSIWGSRDSLSYDCETGTIVFPPIGTGATENITVTT